MKLTERTRSVLAYRRQQRDLTRKGYEQITCAPHGVGNLWELHCGGRYDWKLTDAILGVDGKSVYVLAVPPKQTQMEAA